MDAKRKVKRVTQILYYKGLTKFLDPKALELDPYEHAKLKQLLSKVAPGNSESAVNLRIIGKVNDVGYKEWLRRRAKLKELGFWSRTVSKKEVEVLLIGKASDIEDVVRSSWRGPKNAEVYKVYEHWYNRPVKVIKDRQGNLIEEEVAWSQDTADCIIRTLNKLEKIMREPNRYEKNTRVSGIDELMKECEARDLFHIKSLARDLYVESPDKALGFERSQTTNVPSAIHSLVDQKHLTKRLLKKAGLPVAEGSIFTEFEDAVAYLKKSKGPLVVKPAVGLNGSGVSVDIRNESSLKAAWEYAKKFHREIVIEELIIGVDIRVLVIGGVGRAAYIRVPANVKGDGKKTVEQLIDGKNKLRLSHPHLRKSLIIPDAYTSSFLGRQGYSYKSVVPENEIVFLQLKANISKGGDSVNITEYIHPDLLKLAEEAVKVFRLGDYCGLDLLIEAIDKPRTEQKCTVIELNSTANLEGVKHPLYGKPYNAAHALMNHLFGEKSLQKPYAPVHKEVHLEGLISSRFSEWLNEKIQKHGVSAEAEVQWRCAKVFLSGKQNSVDEIIKEIGDLNNYMTAIIDDVRVSEGKEVRGNELKVRIPFKKLAEDEIMEEEGAHLLEQWSLLETGPDDEPEHSPESSTGIGGSLDLEIYHEVFTKMGYDARHLYKELFEIHKGEEHKAVGIHHSSYFCDQISDRWYPLKQLLRLKGSRVTPGVRLKISERDQAKRYIRKFGGPLTVTQLIPDNMTQKQVNDYSELKDFWKKAKKNGANTMLVEKVQKGTKLCLAVIDQEVVAEQIIVPAMVQGDGVSTVRQLIEKKNALREGHPWYKSRRIEIREELITHIQNQEAGIDTVPEKGRILSVQQSVHCNENGDTINVRDRVHETIKQAAVDAVKAVPGLEYATVYFTVDHPEKSLNDQRWCIGRLDSTPEVGRFHYPWRGEASPLAEKVMKSLSLTERSIDL